jgi:hypothetical protein
MISKFLLFFFLRNKHEFKNFYDINQNKHKITYIPKIYNKEYDISRKQNFIYNNDEKLDNNIKRILFTILD